MTVHDFGFSTKAIHSGAHPDPATGARVTPIYQTASFVFEDVEHAASLFALEEPGYKYSRTANPTSAVLETRIAALENGSAAVAVASGQAAQFIALHALLSSGDNLVAAQGLYGGSINQFEHGFKSFNWEVRWADSARPETFETAINDKTKAIFVESIANPVGAVTDLEAISAIARKYHIPLIVDNTLATPYLIRPFEHGADIVVHSVTKFLGGHGNSLGGVIVDGGSFDWTKDDRYPLLSKPLPQYSGIVLARKFKTQAFAVATRVLGLHDFGPSLSPFNAFLLLTGIETLPLRMQRHSENALKIAEYLSQHPKVGWVSYAGLPDSPFHKTAKKYAPNGAGAVFSFGLRGGYDAGVSLLSKLKLFSHLANIGDVRSLIIHPASTTHKQLTDEQMTRASIGPNVIRVSIGLEDSADLIADLNEALE